VAGNAFPTAGASRFSQPPGAFIRLEPSRPYSMPDPLLGSPSRALLLSRSRTLFPAPFPSWRSNPPSGSCSTRESATPPGCLSRNGARSSPGHFPLQGSLASCVGPTFIEPPLMRFAIRTQASKPHPLQGLPRRRLGLSLSRPPTLLGFLAFWSSCTFEGYWIS
jgi:hypothetical protein